MSHYPNDFHQKDSPFKSARSLAIHAILAAMVCVLGYFALNTGNFKLTFESFPILVAALWMGPISALFVGGVGTLIYQGLRFGFMPTTILWIAPYLIGGFVAGKIAEKKGLLTKSGKLTTKECMVLCIFTQVLITLINTICIFIDAKIYGYYQPALIVPLLIPRFALSIVKGIAFAFIIPRLINAITRRETVHR